MTIDAVNLVELVQSGDQGFQELLADFPGLGATSPFALADLIALNKGQDLRQAFPKPLERDKLKDFAINFHSKAGTLTEEVLNNMELFKSGAPILRIVHQANTLPSLNVFCQFVFLDLVAKRLRSQHSIAPCQVYFVLDHDAAEDRRFRISHFPDIKRREGSLAISSATPVSLRQKLNWAIEKPSLERINEWKSSLTALVKEKLSVMRRIGISEIELGQVGERLKTIEQEILESYNRSSNLSEFNAVLLSRIVNLHWKIPTLFISSTRLSTTLIDYYHYLLRHYPDIVKLGNESVDLLQSKGITIPDSIRPQLNIFPIWYICQVCLVRVPLKTASNDKLDVSGECPLCKTMYQFELGTYSVPNLEPIRSKMVPRVLFNDLIDIVGLGIAGGAGYVRNSEHALISNLVASKLGWHIPPECLWRTRGIYFGTAELEAALILAQENNQNYSPNIENVLRHIVLGRASILYYLLSQGTDGLNQMWNRYFENGGQIHQINVGKRPSGIPENLTVLIEEKCASSIM